MFSLQQQYIYSRGEHSVVGGDRVRVVYVCVCECGGGGTIMVYTR